MEFDFGLIESIFTGAIATFAGIVKYIHSQMVKQMDALRDELKESENMLNGRIDRAKNEHKDHADKTNQTINEINIKLERILTLMEKDDHHA